MLYLFPHQQVVVNRLRDMQYALVEAEGPGLGLTTAVVAAAAQHRERVLWISPSGCLTRDLDACYKGGMEPNDIRYVSMEKIAHNIQIAAELGKTRWELVIVNCWGNHLHNPASNQTKRILLSRINAERFWICGLGHSGIKSPMSYYAPANRLLGPAELARHGVLGMHNWRNVFTTGYTTKTRKGMYYNETGQKNIELLREILRPVLVVMRNPAENVEAA